MAYTPKSDREVKDGKAVVSAKELADFKSQYGEDKSLRDLLNADKGLRRRGEDSASSKTDAAALAAKGQAGNEATKKDEDARVKQAAPVKEAAPAKSSEMPNTYRDLSGKVRVKEAVKPPSEYEPGPQNIKRNLLNAPSDISDLVSSPFRAIREAGNRNNPDAKKMASGGAVSASRRGDGIAQRGKTRGKMC
jgi:hypothetical protein